MAKKKNAASTEGDRKARLRKEFDTLHREMEIAEFATKGHGQYVRKVPRKDSRIRTRKRKLLEKDDVAELAIHADANNSKRLRGSKIAFRKEVIEGSKVFDKKRRKPAEQDDSDDSFNAESSEQSDEGGEDDKEESENHLEEVENEVENDEDGDQEIDDEDDEEEGEEEEEEEEGEDPIALQDEEATDHNNEGDDEASESEPGEVMDTEVETKKPRSNLIRKRKAGSSRGRRKLFKIRNYKSFRMAQRHGDALDAHARGLPKIAVEKLKQVARDAPAAPQVYSALGMVYEDMLQTSFKKSRSAISTEAQAGEPTLASTDELLPDASLAEQLDLAKKAYGSYHVAAILCKKDFTLWVRAADCASEVANLHTRAMLLPNVSDGVIKHHRAEKKRWLSEARHDFIVADNLKPPGIDIPAKLADIEMELGNLSEALTILTDLKNRRNGRGGQSSARTEFEKSYKAWLLYSDLMLRIGHECTQWNRGVQRNQNYMFRRWLRRFSHVFDWQERRLHGLIMALEAAAGSKCCEHLIEWAKQRARRLAEPEQGDVDNKRWHVSSADALPTFDENASEKLDDVSGALTMAEANGRDGKGRMVTADESPTPAYHTDDESQLQHEKSLLLHKNESELNDFDKTTEDMGLHKGSEAAIERSHARLDLVKQQRASMVSLEGDFMHSKQPLPVVEVENHDDIQSTSCDKAQLPISGSVSTVCNTACELMKHCLGMQLYEGGRLVGEVVTLYFKERASLIDQRMQSRADFSRKQCSTDDAVLLSFEPYDEINDNAEMSDDESGQPGLLSDDEHLELDESSGLQDTLRRGVLPTELRVLYALCLVGEGKRDYVAAKCMESTCHLAMETNNWIVEEPLDVGLNQDPLWNTFRRAMTEPLSRTTAFSFVNDVVRKTGKEERWCRRLAPLFRNHLEEISKMGLLDQLTKLPVGVSSYTMMRKNQLLKVIFGAARLDIANAELRRQRAEAFQDLLPAVLSTTKLLTQLLEAFWKVEANGSITRTTVETLDLLARGLIFLFQRSPDRNELQFLKDEAELCNRVVSLFCGCSIAKSSTEANGSDREDFTNEWQTLPVPLTWQSDAHKAISLRAYNLCVACNVSIFSGWEKEEFSLRLLRPWRGASNFFGINVDNGRVSGFLSLSQEADIAEQLDMMNEMLPWVKSINYQTQLVVVKESNWYKSTTEESVSKNQICLVARHGEEAAVNILLCFSKACLMLASLSEGAAKEVLMQNALSVILPMCEFCLDQKLLDWDIGKVSAAVSSFDDWRRLADKSAEAKEINSDEKPKQSFPRRARVERRVDEWLSGKKDRSTLTHVVKLPAMEMLKEWNTDRIESTPTQTFSIEARKAMDRVHVATKQLRHCFTSSATEKASSQVAVALLDLAANNHCQNPILCIQHAAMFASQGSKGGNNDEHFRKALPHSVTECTPLEALLILGRADCLQATYFPNEAAFLCSYVARVCRQHRDRLQPELEWTPQWKVVGILAYNLSVVIRFTMRSLFETDAQKTALRLWERDVVEELERCRADAISWKKQIEGLNASTSEEHAQGDAFSDEEMADNDEVSVGEGDDVDDESVEVDHFDELVQFGTNEEGNISGASNRVDERFKAPTPVTDGALENFYYDTDEEEKDKEPQIVEV